MQQISRKVAQDAILIQRLVYGVGSTSTNLLPPYAKLIATDNRSSLAPSPA